MALSNKLALALYFMGVFSLFFLGSLLVDAQQLARRTHRFDFSQFVFDIAAENDICKMKPFGENVCPTYRAYSIHGFYCCKNPYA